MVDIPRNVGSVVLDSATGSGGSVGAVVLVVLGWGSVREEEGGEDVRRMTGPVWGGSATREGRERLFSHEVLVEVGLVDVGLLSTALEVTAEVVVVEEGGSAAGAGTRGEWISSFGSASVATGKRTFRA